MRKLKSLFQDEANDTLFRSSPDGHADLDDNNARSVYNQTAVQQIYAILRASANKVTSQVVSWSQNSKRCLFGSQLLEDGFNVQKTACSTRAENRR